MKLDSVRHLWDPYEREQAWRLGRTHTGWLVLYGPWSREYIAFSLRPSSRYTPPLTAKTANDPEEQMRRADARSTAAAVPAHQRLTPVLAGTTSGVA